MKTLFLIVAVACCCQALFAEDFGYKNSQDIKKDGQQLPSIDGAPVAPAKEWPTMERMITPFSEMTEKERREELDAIETQRSILYDHSLEKPATAFAECQIDYSRSFEVTMINLKSTLAGLTDQAPDRMGVFMKSTSQTGMSIRIDAGLVPKTTHWSLNPYVLRIKEPGKRGKTILDILVAKDQSGIIELGKSSDDAQWFHQDESNDSWISLSRTMQNDFSKKVGFFGSNVIRVQCRHQAGG